MIYAAAILVIIYISIKLIPYLIGLISAGAVGVQILRSSEMENDDWPKQREDNSIEKRILSTYTSYQDFQDTFEDFNLLSKKAQKKVKKLFDRNGKRSLG